MALFIASVTVSTLAKIDRSSCLIPASMSSSNDIEVALGSAATAYVYLGNVNYETLGGFSMTPYYNVTPDNLFIGYSNTNQNVQVGAQNEIPADRTLIKYLYINNQLGVSLSSYSGDMTCALSMQRGTFSLGNYNLTLPTASTPSANDSSYVIANGTGKFNVIVTSGSSVTVPLGCLASIAPKCTTVTSSPTVTMSSTTGLVAGMKVVGGGIPANTYLSVINSSTQVTLSQNVTTGYTGLYIYFSDYMPIVVKNSLATQTYAFGINAITPPSNGLARQWYMKETNPGGTSFTSISANWNVCDLGNLPASGTFDFVCNTSGSNSQYDVLQPGNTILTAATFGNDSLKVSTFAKQPGDISGGLYLSLVQSDAALPVELSAFTSNINGRTVQLNWETKTEKNSNRFDIERSVSGSAWETIGSVRASVLSNSPKQYSYTVNNLQVGTYQFRLKMVDNDGTFEYGSTIQSEIALPKNYELNQNYPNPFNPSTKLSYSLPNDSKVILDIYSISGEKVGQLVNDNQAAGYYTIDFGSTTMHKNLSSGVYFYRLNAVDKSGKNFTSIKKMVLLK